MRNLYVWSRLEHYVFVIAETESQAKNLLRKNGEDIKWLGTLKIYPYENKKLVEAMNIGEEMLLPVYEDPWIGEGDILDHKKPVVYQRIAIRDNGMALYLEK